MNAPLELQLQGGVVFWKIDAEHAAERERLGTVACWQDWHAKSPIILKLDQL